LFRDFTKCASGSATGCPNVNGFNTPFQRGFFINIQPGETAASQDITIPDGKTLVVEFVSAFGNLPAGEQPLALNIAQSAIAFLVWNFQASANDRDFFVASQQIRFYAKNQLRVNVDRDVTAGSATVHGTVIGYLVNTP
jgi:hypothetical protein